MTPLRRLDEQLVPRLAARLAAIIEAARTRRARWSGRLRASGAGRTRLQRLDDRYASTGPLAVLRDVPQLGLLIATALLVAGGAAAVAQRPPLPPVTSEPAPAAAPPATLGPAVGGAAPAYVVMAAQQLVALSRTAPDSQHLALVSLRAALTPVQAVTVLAGADVQRAYLRAGAAGAEASLAAVEVGDLGPDLRRAYSRTALARAAAQRDYLSYVRTLSGTRDGERALIALYVALARSAGIEAAAYRGGCACVVAAVVRGSARALAELPALKGVRAVQAAPVDADLRTLQIAPLLPEVTGVVPRPTARQSG